ncbi:reverse transcriptase [Gossypium australe]|uniref:Reverse transcriptase n=1 Tax=Gossypium australe TaxID=47621 RepID=A0A5B6WU38_9ROSI|nr:reverse transcriptase [Gossypium australe]
MAPYEALYRCKCRTPLCWTMLGENKDHLRATSDQQKSYSDLKRKDIELTIGDRVFLKVSPWKKVLRFGCKGKLSPMFIGPYRIIKRVTSRVGSYPRRFSCVHVERNQIPLTKVLWMNHDSNKATWELEDSMR